MSNRQLKDGVCATSEGTCKCSRSRAVRVGRPDLPLMARSFRSRAFILLALVSVWQQFHCQALGDGSEGFGDVQDCRLLSYEEQQFFNLKLPSFRTDWISPDFIQSALPHTPAKVQRLLTQYAEA